jgi:hypothetical protein
MNPLRSLLWMFDLPAVAGQNLYIQNLPDTQTTWDVHVVIANFHAGIRHRPIEAIPHWDWQKSGRYGSPRSLDSNQLVSARVCSLLRTVFGCGNV